MKTAVIAIGRGENLYAREFVQHYKNLGFTNVIIVDNNYGDEERFDDVLQDYIDDGFVIIERGWRGRMKCQMQAYTYTYNKYKNDYDWIAYFDFDEFLILNNHSTIGEFLSEFPNDAQVVLVNWLIMTDNNLVKYDPRPLMERFTQPMPIEKCVQYNFPDNCHVKSILRGGMDDISFTWNPHTTANKLRAYTASKVVTNNHPFQNIDYRSAYLMHFTTKTAEEYCDKLRKGVPTDYHQDFLKVYAGRFFKYNEMTEEKVRFFEERGFKGV